MKKVNFSTLSLDKETVAKLDDEQLNAIVGGAKNTDEPDDEECYAFSCKEKSCHWASK